MGAAETETAGMQALGQGRVTEAVQLLERAVGEFRAAGDDAGALGVLGNLAFLSLQTNDLARARAFTDQALSLPVPPAQGALALVNCAGVLDRLGDKRARGIWMLAAQGFVGTQPLMQLVCLAHGIGAEVAQSSAAALTAARALLTQVGPGASPSLLAGLVGAMGESAGARGQPLLAQAVWLLAKEPAAFNGSTQPHWAALLEQLGYDSDLAVPCCVLALGALLARQGQRDVQALSAATKPVFDACAAARGLDETAFAALVQQSVPTLERLPDQLKALVSDEWWVLPRPA
jgi:hypothetical protein